MRDLEFDCALNLYRFVLNVKYPSLQFSRVGVTLGITGAAVIGSTMHCSPLPSKNERDLRSDRITCR